MNRFIGFLAFILILSFPLNQIFCQTDSDTLFTLEKVVSSALKDNPDLKASYQLWQASRNRISQALAPSKPQLGVRYEGLPLGSFNLSKYELRTFLFSQELMFPSRYFSMRKMSVSESDIASSFYQDKKLEIIQKAKSAYLDLFLNLKSIEIIQENLNLLEHFLKVTQIKYSTGEAPQSDILKAQVELAKMNNELVTMRAMLEVSKGRLNILMNRLPSILLSIQTDIIIPDFTWVLSDLQDKALYSNPLLTASKSMVDVQKNSFSLAKQGYLPDFMFEYMRMKTKEGMRDWGLEFRTSIPLWFLLKEKNEVNEKKANLLSAESDYQKMKNEISFEVQMAYVNTQASYRLMKLYQESFLAQAEEALKVAEANYTANLTDFLTLLDAQRTLRETRLDYYKAIVDYLQNLASLERAVGANL